jgi:L-ascorbate metabolism protein UlaG (beta-lactamase superfamily)
VRPYLKYTLLGLTTLLVGFLGVGTSLGCFAFSAPGYTGPKSEHFDGTRFHNQVRSAGDKGFIDFVRWMSTREQGKWKSYTRVPFGPPPPARVEGDRLRVTVVNHATVLIQTAGLNILTDPIWSERASPVKWAGPKRRRPPGIRFADLPKIDVVLISHNHYDHLDIPTLKKLAKRDKPRIFAGLGNRKLLEKKRIGRGRDFDWWDRVTVKNNVEITFVPAQHFSGRGLCDRNKTLWGGFVIQSPHATVYFAGDTGFGPHFKQIADRFTAIDLALLPIGAFKPRWFMRDMHISPEEAIKVHLLLGARHSVSIHYGTFSLADDAQHEPVQRLHKIRKQVDLKGTAFWTLPFGRGRWVPLAQKPAATPATAHRLARPPALERTHRKSRITDTKFSSTTW